jgi:hypothetical protein
MDRSMARRCRGRNWLERYERYVLHLVTFHSLSNFLGPDHEMNDTVRCGDEEAVKIFAQLLDFVAARDAVNFEK